MADALVDAQKICPSDRVVDQQLALVTVLYLARIKVKAILDVDVEADLLEINFEPKRMAPNVRAQFAKAIKANFKQSVDILKGAWGALD